MACFKLICLMLMLCACSAQPTKKLKGWTTLPARTQPLTYVYRIKAPKHWVFQAVPLETIQDTTLPISEFRIQEGDRSIHITIHSFPSQTQEDRIPPMAQIARWQRQFDYLNPASIVMAPQAFSGFVGQLFEGEGILKDKPTGMMAWSLSLASEHYLLLSYPLTSEQQKEFPLQRADVTIKAMGPPDLMTKHRQAIITFARSFELINALPVRA